MRRLSKEDIIETTGVSDLQEIETLELLFTTCDEIGSLDECRTLRRLSMLDNGLKRISNLEPVSVTLQSLCLCDQEITTMENLNLPNLKELFLHRNCITKIENLHNCPRLKRLWLSQNKITAISGLHAVPELEELYIQANSISKLSGIETCSNLKSLAISGNQISEYIEIRKLSSLLRLRDLSFQDIHFGRCVIVDDDGYKDFIICYLKQISILDGVLITKEKEMTAQDNLYNEIRQFNEQLAELEVEYRRDLQSIGGRQQNTTSQSMLLENEMQSALKELESLVNEGRHSIHIQLEKQKVIFQNNLESLENNLDAITTKAKAAAERNNMKTISELDTVEAQIAVAEGFLIDQLCKAGDNVNVNINSNATSNDEEESGRLCVAYQSLGDNIPDFQMIASLIQSSNVSSSSSSNHVQQRPSSASTSTKRQNPRDLSPRALPQSSTT
eukprot:gene9742-20259_t